MEYFQVPCYGCTENPGTDCTRGLESGRGQRKPILFLQNLRIFSESLPDALVHLGPEWKMLAG